MTERASATSPHDSDERLLSQRVMDGEVAAGDELYEKYDRLIRFFARHLAGQLHNGSISEEDLVQAGWEFALNGVRRHSETGVDEDTLKMYMVNFMHEKLASVVDTQYAVQVPIERSRMIRKVLSANASRMNDGKAPLSDAEIAEYLEIPDGPSAPAYTANSEFSVGALHHTVKLTRFMGSTDSGFNPHQDWSSGEAYERDEINHMKSVFAEDNPKTLDESSIEQRMRTDVASVLKEMVQRNRITEQSKEVIELSFGIDPRGPLNHEKIGKLLKIPMWKVALIEKKALVKVRQAARAEKLNEYIDAEEDKFE
jgi:DNA-directed RNA polymerase specialized sigma subunit